MGSTNTSLTEINMEKNPQQQQRVFVICPFLKQRCHVHVVHSTLWISFRCAWHDQDCDKMRGHYSRWHVRYVMSGEGVGGTPGKRLRVPWSRDKSNGRLWTSLLDVFRARSSLASKIKTIGWVAELIAGGMGREKGPGDKKTLGGGRHARLPTWQLAVGRVSHQMTNRDRLMFFWSVTDYITRSGQRLNLEFGKGELENMWL